MYGIMTGLIPTRTSEHYIIQPLIDAALDDVKYSLACFEKRERHKWVQKIKTNYRKNKRKRIRCRKKIK